MESDIDSDKYNNSDGEPDFTLEDDEDFWESFAEAQRWPRP
ncbi:MAG TPA: hypothetical protein VJ180_09135 [Pyrinomonadaceae bacterium]|nr:hypothetical protein [Pyrinomonadaceae bacterium]